MKQIRFAKVTLEVVIPVCSRTPEEAIEIARDSIEDYMISWPKWPVTVGLLDSQPESITENSVVWGECVPEDHDTIGKLSKHLEEQS